MNASFVLALFQKFHRELCLFLLLLFGLACGQLVATVTGMALRSEASLKTVSQPTPRRANLQIRDRDLDQILQQNLFDPAARGQRAVALKPSAAEQRTAQSTRKDLTLVGTLVSGTDSTALVEVDKKIKLFHLEDSFADGGRIESIQRNRVIIRNRDESTTELTVLKEPSSKPVFRSTDGGNIRAVGDNRWQVSRNTADAARTNIAEQLRLAQMEPRIINGRTDGFLVSKLNPKSLLTQMGIRRGDVILRVNNMPLDSPEKALQILQQLREARQLTVDLERQNKPMTFAYEIN